MYSGWDGAGRDTTAASLMSAPKVELTQSIIGSTVRKLAVSSTRPPAAPKRQAASRNVEMSARRNR